MPDSTVAALTAASTLTGAELLYVVQGGADRKTTAAEVAASGIKNNLTATRDPLTTDDASAGYAAGSMWMRSDAGSAWRCRDATANAARWTRLDTSDFFGYRDARWYHAWNAAVGAGVVGSSTVTRAHPFILKERCTISQLGARVTTAVSGNCVFAIYAAGTDLLPTGTALATSSANVSTAATGAVASTLTASVTLEPGLYWFAVQVDNATVVFQAYTPVPPVMSCIIGGTQAQIAPANTSGGGMLSYTTTYGTWPDLTGVSPTYLNAAPVAMQFLVASIP